MKFKNLKVFKSKNIDSQEFYLTKNSNEINQISGYYFENTLHFYGYLTLNNFDDIRRISFFRTVLYFLSSFVCSSYDAIYYGILPESQKKLMIFNVRRKNEIHP